MTTFSEMIYFRLCVEIKNKVKSRMFCEVYSRIHPAFCFEVFLRLWKAGMHRFFAQNGFLCCNSAMIFGDGRIVLARRVDV